MKKVFFILMLLFIPLSYSIAQDENPVDSLRKKANQLPHNGERLELLTQIVKISQSSPNVIKDARILLHEAQKQHNDSVISVAATYIANYFYNFTNDNVDSIKYWVDYGAPIAHRCSYWKIYFELKRDLINAYIFDDRFEYAIDEAIKMRKEAQKIGFKSGEKNAYFCESLAYYGSKRWKETHDILLKAHSIHDAQESPFMQINILVQLMEYYIQNERFANMEVYLKELQSLYDNLIAQSPELRYGLNDHLLLLECYQIYFYASRGEFNQVEKHLAAAKNYKDNIGAPQYNKKYADACCFYNLKRKNYGEALRLNDSILVMIKRYELQEDDHIYSLALRANILYDMGDYANALKLYKRSQSLRDSLSTSISEKQMNEIKQMYSIDYLKMKNEELTGKVQATLLIFIVILICVCLYYIFRLSFIRRILRKAEKETQEALKISEEANEQKGRFLSTMSHAIRTPLTSVVGISQCLATDTDIDSASRQEYATIVRTETDRLMYLVTSVLDLSRLEAGMTKWQMSECDLIQLCHDAVSSAGMQNVDVKTDFQCNQKECIVRTDFSRMMQLMVSILAGSVTFSSNTSQVVFTITEENNIMHFCVKGSPLADKSNDSQAVSLRNNINRMTLEYFGGSYIIEEGSVRFSFPIN